MKFRELIATINDPWWAEQRRKAREFEEFNNTPLAKLEIDYEKLHQDYSEILKECIPKKKNSKKRAKLRAPKPKKSKLRKVTGNVRKRK